MRRANNNKGFTIIELAIALAVLSFAVIGIYNAFSNLIIATTGISSRFTAAYLAQEGIEIIRNMRDNNWLHPNPINPEDWLYGFDVCAGTVESGGCEADYTTGTDNERTPLGPWTGEGNFLSINGYNLYGYDQNYPFTNFKRRIIIERIEKSISNPDGTSDVAVVGAKVIVTVYWYEKGAEYSIAAEDHLYNWY